jgi:type IX secretion system PorP/SprF family membrane protein
MKKIITSTIIILLLVVTNANSQQLPLGSQYYVNMYTINPAEVGTSSLQSYFSHRSQFTGITNGPQTSYISVDGPTKYKKMGLGFMAMSDRTDILSKNTFVVSYSYKLKFSENHGLNFGINMGILNNSIAFDKATIIDEDDAVVSNSSRSRTGFTSDFGLLYTLKDFQFGISVPQIFANSNLYINTAGEKFSFTSSRHYRSSLKYSFYMDKSKNLSLYPMLVGRYVSGVPFQYDANIVLDSKNLGWLGFTYHSNYAFSTSLGLRFQNIVVGYVYDFPMGDLNRFTGGSHEFILGYRFGNQNKNELNFEESNKKIKQLETTQNKHEKLIDSLIKTNDKLYQDAMVQNDLLDSLIKRFTEMKDINDIDDNEGIEVIRTGQSLDFTNDDDGTEAKKGYYVVVGSFNVLDFTKRFKNQLINNGYEQARYLQRKGSEIKNVYLFFSEDQNEAIKEKAKYKNVDENVWVLRIE